MDHETTLKQQTMAGATAAESQWKTGQLQSQQTITAMERRLQEQQLAKTALEQRMTEQKYQLEQLRAQLNTTEETSHDFVRLSQNLQVRLSQLTAQQREVHWEHEDNVTESRTCQKKFVSDMTKLESPPPNHSQLSLMPLSTSASVSQPLQPSETNSTTTATTSTTLDGPQLGLAGARQGDPFAALELAPFSEQSMPSESLCSAGSSSHSTRRTMSNDSALLLGLAEGGLDTQRRSSSAQDVHETPFQPIAATTSASSLEALAQGSGQSGTVSFCRQSSADPFSCSAPASRHSPVTVSCHSCAQLRARLDQSTLNLSSAESKIEMVESQLAVRECKREDLQATVDKLTHHCRQCGKIYCSDCSSKTVTRAPGTRPLRVCSPCYSTITTETPVVLASDATALESSASHLLS